MEERYSVSITEEKNAPLILVSGEEESLEELLQEIRERTRKPFSLILHRVTDWNKDLSPWPADPVMKKAEPFGGEADSYLKQLTDEVIPEVLQQNALEPEWIGLAGYSLAGLFALYSMYQTDRFDRFVSASGSMWYPGFLDYCRTYIPVKKPQEVYLSLGDAEAKTKHPLMKTVQDCTEELAEYFREKEIPVQYELNPGNHFKDATVRLSKGIAWILNQD